MTEKISAEQNWRKSGCFTDKRDNFNTEKKI